MATMRAALGDDAADGADFVADFVFELLLLLTSCVDRALDAEDAEP